MFKTIRTFIAKRKAAKINAAITAISDLVKVAATNNVVVICGLYRDTLQHVVTKTEEDPAPLLDLLNAVEAVTKHYGPGLKQFASDAVGKLQAADVKSEEVQKLLDAVMRDEGDEHA